MATMADILAMVRRDLGDEDVATRCWSDESLERHIRHALADLSIAAPPATAALVATTSGSREIAVGMLEGLFRVEAVEYPPGWRRRFTSWGGVVRLMEGPLPDGGLPALVQYYATYSLDGDGGLPDELADLLALGAEGYACLELAAASVNRVNAGGSGPPLYYQRLGEARLEYFRAEAARPGPGGSLRTAELYRE